MKIIRYFTVVMTSLFIYAGSAIGSDMAREKRMADQIVDAILDGEAVFLQADGNEFLGIYTEADESKGAAIILHGRGFHPDWQDAINPLRVGLAEAGWNTLSVQMPVLEKQAKYYDYVPLFPEALPRIDAAIGYAREQGNDRVVLIAHSCGSHMAMAWVDAQLGGRQSETIDAYVGIGMGATDYQQFMEKALPLDKMAVPVLDVYAENDYPTIIRHAPERLRMITIAGNAKNQQKMVLDAGHYYENRGEALTRVVGQWLDTL